MPNGNFHHIRDTTTVDETPITLGEVIAYRQGVPDYFQDMPDEILLQSLIQKLVQQQALANAAGAIGLDQTRALALTLQNQRRAAMAEAFVANAAAQAASDAAIAAAYDRDFLQAEPVEEAHIAHIVVPDRQIAQDLKDRLDAGADFAALAAQHSTDGAASRGGDLGFVSRDILVPAFAEAAFALQPGVVSDPVQTPIGWHLITIKERRVRPVPPLEAVRDELAQTLREAAAQKALEDAAAAAQVTYPVTLPPAVIRDDSLIK